MREEKLGYPKFYGERERERQNKRMAHSKNNSAYTRDDDHKFQTRVTPINCLRPTHQHDIGVFTKIHMHVQRPLMQNGPYWINASLITHHLMPHVLPFLSIIHK